MGGSSSKQQEQKKLDSSLNCANGNKAPEAENLAGEVTELDEEMQVHTEPILTLCTLGEEQLLSAGVNRDVVLYSWTKEQACARFNGAAKDVTKVHYNTKSGLIYAASRDRVIYAWKWPRAVIVPDRPSETDKRGKDRIATQVLWRADQTFNGHTLGVTALASNDEYSELLVSGSRDNSVGLWDIVTSKSISSMYAPRNLVTGLEWIDGEKAVLQSSEDKTLRVWDLRSCSTVQHFRARNYVQTCCAVSDSRQEFLSGNTGTEGVGAEVNLWDRRNEKRPIREFKGHTENVCDCMFLSYCGQQLVVSAGKDSTIRAWDKESGAPLITDYRAGVGPFTALVSLAPGLIGASSFYGGIILWALLEDVKPEPRPQTPLTLSLQSQYH